MNSPVIVLQQLEAVHASMVNDVSQAQYGVFLELVFKQVLPLPLVPLPLVPLPLVPLPLVPLPLVPLPLVYYMFLRGEGDEILFRYRDLRLLAPIKELVLE